MVYVTLFITGKLLEMELLLTGSAQWGILLIHSCSWDHEDMRLKDVALTDNFLYLLCWLFSQIAPSSKLNRKINNRVRIPSHKSHTKTISRSPTQCLHTKKKIKIEKNQQETFHLHVSGNMSRQWFRFHFLQDPRLKAN